MTGSLRHELWRWDFLLATILWLTLATLMWNTKYNVVARTQQVEALVMSTTARQSMQEFYAWYGVWPSQNEIDKVYESGNASRLAIDNGRYTAQYGAGTPALSGLVLSFAPAVSPTGAITIWRCGSHALPNGFQLASQADTTIERSLLNGVCK